MNVCVRHAFLLSHYNEQNTTVLRESFHCICFLESQKKMCLLDRNCSAKSINIVHYTLIKSYVDLAFPELLQEYLNFIFRMCHVFFLTNLNTLLTTNKHCLGFGRNHSRRTGYCAKSPGACPGPVF